MKCPNCSRVLRATGGMAESLSVRQYKMAMLCARGMTRDEIAQELNTNGHNVRQHLMIVKAKIGARTDVELALFMFGLLDQAVKAEG